MLSWQCVVNGTVCIADNEVDKGRTVIKCYCVGFGNNCTGDFSGFRIGWILWMMNICDSASPSTF